MFFMQIWERFERLPFRALVYRWFIRRTVPYSGSIYPDVMELRPGYARVCVQDRKRIRNHLDSIHAVALMNLCELTSGLALLSGINSQTRGILVRFSMDFKKKARGKLTATCEVVVPTVFDKVEQLVQVDCQDQSGETVCTAEAHWLLSPR